MSVEQKTPKKRQRIRPHKLLNLSQNDQIGTIDVSQHTMTSRRVLPLLSEQQIQVRQDILQLINNKFSTGKYKNIFVPRIQQNIETIIQEKLRDGRDFQRVRSRIVSVISSFSPTQGANKSKVKDEQRKSTENGLYLDSGNGTTTKTLNSNQTQVNVLPQLKMHKKEDINADSNTNANANANVITITACQQEQRGLSAFAGSKQAERGSQLNIGEISKSVDNPVTQNIWMQIALFNKFEEDEEEAERRRKIQIQKKHFKIEWEKQIDAAAEKGRVDEVLDKAYSAYVQSDTKKAQQLQERVKNDQLQKKRRQNEILRAQISQNQEQKRITEEEKKQWQRTLQKRAEEAQRVYEEQVRDEKERQKRLYEPIIIQIRERESQRDSEKKGGGIRGSHQQQINTSDSSLGRKALLELSHLRHDQGEEGDSENKRNNQTGETNSGIGSVLSKRKKFVDVDEFEVLALKERMRQKLKNDYQIYWEKQLQLKNRSFEENVAENRQYRELYEREALRDSQERKDKKQHDRQLREKYDHELRELLTERKLAKKRENLATELELKINQSIFRKMHAKKFPISPNLLHLVTE